MRLPFYWASYLSHSISLRLALLIVGIILFASCDKSVNNDKNSAAAYKKILDTATKFYDTKKTNRFIAYLDSATRRHKNIPIPLLFENYSLHCGYYLHNKIILDSANYYADKMLALFQNPENREKYPKLYSNANISKGDAQFDMGNYSKAFFYLFQGKMAASSSNAVDSCSISDFSYRMGMILYKQEHYEDAANQFKSAFKESENCDAADFRIFYRRQELLSNIGLSYSNLNKTDSALHYYRLALAFIDKDARKFQKGKILGDVAKAVIYGNTASEYIKLKQYNKAKVLLKKSVAINLLPGNDQNDAISTELKLASLFEKQNQTDSMLPVLNNVKEHLERIPNNASKTRWNYLMASYLTRKGDLASAISYFKNYDSIKTVVAASALALKETDVYGQFRRFEKEYELNRLKKNNEMQRLYLIIALSYGVIALIVIILVLQYWRRSKQNLLILGGLNNQIKSQNIVLENTLQELKERNEEKDRILRTVAHDLRNPIGGIASLTNAILSDDDLDAEQRVYVKLIKDAAFNSIELINDILEAANNKNDTLEKQLVDINDVLTNSVELLRFKAAEKNQRITLSLPETPPNHLMASREKIWRVISNLISNAIKFSSIGTDIHVELTELDDAVRISVVDNGIGIQEGIKGSVFNMFTEAKRPGTLGEKSFGLGLSICKHILEMHQGDIWFEANPLGGTIFHISLPKTVQSELKEVQIAGQQVE